MRSNRWRFAMVVLSVMIAFGAAIWWARAGVRAEEDFTVRTTTAMPQATVRQAAIRPASAAAARDIPSAQTPQRTSHVDVDDAPAPTAECLAARARAAAERAELAALSAAELEARIEKRARKDVADQELLFNVLKACEDKPDYAVPLCLIGSGGSLAGDLVQAYRAHEALQAAYRTHAQHLASRGDARSLIAAADILPMIESDGGFDDTAAAHTRDPQAIDWVVLAQRRGWNDALVQWSVATFPHRDSATAPPALRAAQRAALGRLRLLEADNAAVYLLSLQADRSSPQGLTAAQFMRAEAMPRYRVPMGGEAALVLDALRVMPDIPGLRSLALLSEPTHTTATHCASDADIARSHHVMLAALTTFALPIPPVGACAETAVGTDAPLRASCLRFHARLYANASTWLERSLAVGVSRRLETDNARLALWQQRHRQHRWQMEQYSRIITNSGPYAEARAFGAGLRGSGELFGVDVLLREAGISLDPPPDWKAPGE